MSQIEPRLAGDVTLDEWDRLFERSPHGMATLVDSTFSRVNPALCEMIGLSHDELIGANATRLAEAMLMTDEVASTTEAFHNGERRLHLEGPLRRPDGAVRWVGIDTVVTEVSDAGEVSAMATVIELTELHRTRAELAAGQRRFRRLLNNVGDTVWIVDAEGHVISSTGSANGLLGYPEHRWQELVPGELVHPGDGASFIEFWNEVLASPGRTIATEVRVRRHDGGWEELAMSSVNLLADPDIAGVIITTRPITDLRRAQRLSASQAEVLEMIARGASLTAVAQACVAFVQANGNTGRASIYLLDGDQLILSAGGAPATLARYMAEPIRHPGRSLCDAAMASGKPAIVADVDVAPIEPELRTIAETEGIRAAWSQPVVISAGDQARGSVSTIYTEAHEPSDDERQVADVAATLMGIAIERSESEARLAHQAMHDVLTGLPNRALLQDRLEHAIARRTRSDAGLAVLFCDIDRFKVVNDSLGHGVGDELLIALAHRFQRAVDPGDTVARFGGDEFVILMEDVTDADGPTTLAARLAHELDEPFVLSSGQEVYLTVSVGLTHASDHRSGDAWLRDADAAMYRAKEQGRNRVAHFDSTMREAAVERLAMENDLRRAVERDELVVHYQPVVDLGTGRIVGAEALVRWQHPERGLLPPSSFITVAEDTGVIDELGRHVLDRSVAAMAELLSDSAQPHFQLGVNVSARQLDQSDLDAVVADACNRYGWPPASLILEITESALFQDADEPVDLLERVRTLGVQLAIDDFGTGHSSLTRLGRTPVSQVKVDQTFVAALDVPGDPLGKIVDAVVAVAGALGLRICAEGVETQTQLDHLRRLRCHQAQGYFFARPLPLDQFAALLAADPRW